MQIVAVGEDDSVQGCVALGWLGCGSLPEPLDLQEQIPVENVITPIPYWHLAVLHGTRTGGSFLAPCHADCELLPNND